MIDFMWLSDLRNLAIFHIIICSKKPLPRHAIQLKKEPGLYSLWDDLFLEIKASSKPLTLENENRAAEFVDADKLEMPLLARSIETGDFFYPVNGAGKKKAKDYFIDAKVLFHERTNIPIIESSGQIVWLCGHRLDDRFKVTEKTRNIYQLQLIKRER